MQHKAGFWFPDSDTHFGEHTFEIGHFDNLLPLLKNRRIAIDGGAHVGSWSIRMAKEFDTVLSFEPLKSNYECLIKNTKHLPNVKTLNYAIGHEKGTASMHDPVNPGNSGAGWLMDGNDFEIVAIDDFNLTDVDFIKLDVEGFEPFAIDGAVETIKRCKPIVLVEQKPITARFNLDYMAAGSLLMDMGYKEVMKMNNDYVYAPA